MPYRCDFEADEPPDNPDRFIDGEPFLYHPTAGPDGPGGTAAAFDPADLPDVRPGDSGAVRCWLRGLGARAVRVVFDGGNDEGFAAFDAALMGDGELSIEELSRRGAEDGTGAAILEAHRRPGESWGPAEHTRTALEQFAEELACRFLGHEGWGTGPFLLFGAFEADLATGRFTDLRDVEKPDAIWADDLPPRYPPGYHPPPAAGSPSAAAPRRGPLAALFQRLFRRER